MSTITIEHDDAWQVWIGLDSDSPPPDGYSFIIGVGATRDDAVAEAIADLAVAIAQLQAVPR